MKQRWWNSLRSKIIAWSFVPTVIILSAVAWFTFYSYQKEVGERAIQQFLEMAKPKSQLFYSGIARLFINTTIEIFLNIDTNHELPLEERTQTILEQAPF